MKKYEKFINKNNVLQNSIALVLLLEYGRKNLLDDKCFKEISKEFINGENPLMSIEYKKEIVDIARNMAQINDKDLCDFIYDKIKNDRRQEKSRL